MKTAVESVSPTRVKLTVEVPFDELKPSLDVAYKKIAGQVRISGFRPGKVPPRIIDQRVGRGYVLEEAVNDAIPRFYGDAVRDNEVKVVGQPHVDVTEFGDGAQLVFTAEVDVRPEITLPDYTRLPVTVDSADVTDEQLDDQLEGLRDRFAVLTGVERPAQTGDYVSIDLEAAADGEPLAGASAKGMSYEIGSGSLLTGLDDALVGLSAGESTTFQTELVGGEYAGKTADVTVTVNSVKAKEVPDLDDEFAQTASEFDTLAELRDDLRDRLGRVRLLEQGAQARDRVLEVLMERTEVPLPESLVEAEYTWRRDNMSQQLSSIGMSLDDYLASEQKSPEEFDTELRTSAEEAVKAQFLLDAIASKEEIGVNEAELTEHIIRRAQSAGVAPQDFANSLSQSGQFGLLFAEVLRGKALALVLEQAVVTDGNGEPVDLSRLGADDIDLLEEAVEEGDLELGEGASGEASTETSSGEASTETSSDASTEGEPAGAAQDELPL